MHKRTKTNNQADRQTERKTNEHNSNKTNQETISIYGKIVI